MKWNYPFLPCLPKERPFVEADSERFPAVASTKKNKKERSYFRKPKFSFHKYYIASET